MATMSGEDGVRVMLEGGGGEWMGLGCLSLLFSSSDYKMQESVYKVCEQKLWRMDIWGLLSPKGKKRDLEDKFVGSNDCFY